MDAPLPQPSADLTALVTDVWGRLARFIGSFMAGLAAAVANPLDEPQLLAAVEELRRIQADVAAVDRFRPWLTAWSAVDEVIARLRSVAHHYLTSASSALPIDGQREAQLAQLELDMAASRAAELSEFADLWSKVESVENPEELIAQFTERAFLHSGATNLIEFDRAGDEVFKRVTGRSGCPQGLGFGLNLIAVQAHDPFDEGRFWDVAQQAFQLLTSDPNWLTQLVGDSEWIDDLRSGLLSLGDAGQLQHAALAAVRHDRQAVRVLLDYGQDLVEGLGKRLAASLLAAHHSKPYATYGAQSSGNLLIAVHDAGLGNLITGLDRAIRTASAHEEFELDSDEVVLLDRGVAVERLSVPALVDRILAGVETTMSLALAVLCAASVAGIDATQLAPPPDTLGLSPSIVAAMVLSGAGWQGVSADYTDGVLRVEGIANLSALTPTHAAALIPHLPEDCTEIILRGSSSEGVHELSGSPEPLRQFSKADGDLQKQLFNIETLRLWRRDGEPLVSPDQVRKVLSVHVLQAAGPGDLRTFLHSLRSIRATAQRLDDHALANAIAAVMGTVRNNLAGVGRDELPDRLQPITKWASKKVPPLSL